LIVGALDDVTALAVVPVAMDVAAAVAGFSLLFPVIICPYSPLEPWKMYGKLTELSAFIVNT
jgi:hypothetical protein